MRCDGEKKKERINFHLHGLRSRNEVSTGCHSFAHITRLFPLVYWPSTAVFFNVFLWISPCNSDGKVREKKASRILRLINPHSSSPASSPFFSFLLVFLFLSVSPFFICVRTSSLRNVNSNLLFAPTAQRQHTNERRPTSVRHDTVQFSVSFAILI